MFSVEISEPLVRFGDQKTSAAPPRPRDDSGTRHTLTTCMPRQGKHLEHATEGLHQKKSEAGSSSLGELLSFFIAPKPGVGKNTEGTTRRTMP